MKNEKEKPVKMKAKVCSNEYEAAQIVFDLFKQDGITFIKSNDIFQLEQKSTNFHYCFTDIKFLHKTLICKYDKYLGEWIHDFEKWNKLAYMIEVLLA